MTNEKIKKLKDQNSKQKSENKSLKKTYESEKMNWLHEVARLEKKVDEMTSNKKRSSVVLKIEENSSSEGSDDNGPTNDNSDESGSI